MNGRARLAPTVDAAATFVVAAAILGAAAGSSVQFDVWQVGRPVRWILLAVLLLFGLVRAAVARATWTISALTAFALASFCGIALVSTAWSVNGHGTLVRALGVTATISAAAAIAGSTRSSPTLAARVLDGVLAAALVVAIAGFVYWLISPSHAVVAATTEYPSRYQGIEQNPNTAPLLFAFGAAVAFSRALRARDAWLRAFFVLALLVLAASIVASASRGGLLGAFAGVLVVAAQGPRALRHRVALSALTVAALVVGAWVMTLPNALPAGPAPATRSATKTADAEDVLPLSQEIGNPWWTHRAGGSERSLFNTSIRARALGGTFDRIEQRPIAGYGFGTEQWAFVNRYYAYDSQNPENGYVGILLQIGAVGLAVFLAMLAVCVGAGVRALSATRDGVAVATLGATAAGLTLGLSQSFFHGPGSIAYVAFWMSLLLTATIPLRGRALAA